MKAGPLPHWPDEVLVEWLHRHNREAHKYAFLRFEALTLRKETWPLHAIPGREAFDNPKFCDDFSNIEDRARKSLPDWLAQYMLGKGTWNTPIVLLENLQGGIHFPDGTPLRSPYHLLEGHRRLSFLNGLRVLGRAAPDHDVWLATWKGTP